MQSLSWDGQRVGDSICELRFPVTWKTLLLAFAGTRDAIPYHHHHEFAQSTGARGPFVNTMFYQGLLGRYVTDWSGPDAELRSLSIAMGDQLCPGDIALVRGTVSDKRFDRGHALVELEIEVRSERGPAVTATAVLEMPSSHGSVTPARLDDGSPSSSITDVPEAARRVLGERQRREGPYPVSEAQIMYWCEMVRDADPRYAGNGRPGPDGVIAPPTMLMIWCQGRATQIGVDPEHPDVDVPEQPAWPNTATVGLASFRMPGTTAFLAQRVTAEFGVPLRPGDRVSATSEVSGCTPLKRTRLGQGHFVTFFDVYRNQRDEIVGRTTITAFHYRTGS